MTDKQRAYSDSSRRSEQLSCIKLFHLSYGLFSKIFQRFKQFAENYRFYFNSKKLSVIAMGTHRVYPEM